MWKDFFYFSRGQRVGIAVFIGVILITVAIRSGMPLFFVSKPVWMTQTFQSEVDSFLSQVTLADSIKQSRFKYDGRDFYPHKNYSDQKTDFQLFPFDPNLIDSIGLIRLGIRPYIAKNIIKFRSRGGRFKTADDFAKVYGLKPEQFNQLKEFIEIKSVDSVRIYPEKNEITTEIPIIVELNSADTSLLMRVKGIGKYLATAIVRFRQLSGGFVNVQQLKEIKGLTEQQFDQIRPFCSVNTEKINKIRINIASVDKLKSHPYLGFYRARSLYEYRRKVGKVKNIDEIDELEEFTPEDIQKIKPYLSFE